MLATSSTLVFHSPSLSCSPSILFVLLLWLALWWKNFVFLFPASSQIDLNFCHQNPSSWCSSSLISFFTTFILSTFCPKPPCTKSANSLCSASNLVLLLPKVRLRPTPCYKIQPALFYFFKEAIHWTATWLSLTPWLPNYVFAMGCVTHFSSKHWIRWCRRWR